MSQQKVIVLGASPKEDRYSNKAVQQLLNHGHQVFPIHPTCDQILGQTCYKSLAEVPEPVDTITLYVGADKSTELAEKILGLKPKRIIMNPGAENAALAQQAKQQNIEVVEGCTLVMLRTKQF
jgi:predicted CoA-binding protein